MSGPSRTHRRPHDGGIGVWDVDRLWELAAPLPTQTVPLAQLREEYEQVYWFGGSRRPTVAAVVEHARRILAADREHPVILSASGVVMDGMHRVARALFLGADSIEIVQFVDDPPPDRVLPTGD